MTPENKRKYKGYTVVRIGTIKARQYAQRGIQVSLPNIWVHDNNLEPSQQIDFYRTTIDGIDAIVIIPADKSKQIKNYYKELTTSI